MTKKKRDVEELENERDSYVSITVRKSMVPAVNRFVEKWSDPKPRVRPARPKSLSKHVAKAQILLKKLFVEVKPLRNHERKVQDFGHKSLNAADAAWQEKECAWIDGVLTRLFDMFPDMSE